jgi:dTDP-4-dehydrorhamnose reductase
VRILVLGPNGQLGGDLMDAAAADRRFSATGIGRDAVDVADADALRAFLAAAEFDALVNCTSYHKTDEVEAHADRAMAINAKAPAAMAEICADKRARFLHVSTDYVFGGDAGRATPLTEADPTAPVNVYGLSKQFGETLVGLTGCDATVFRVASLFGVRGASGKGGNFVETMIRFGREKGALKVVDDQVMSPTATAFIARAILAFLAAGGPAGVYHCVNTGAVSWAGFARRIVERCGIAATVTPCATAEWPTPARRPAYSALDNSKLAGVIGPVEGWEAALDAYLAAKGHMA